MSEPVKKNETAELIKSLGDELKQLNAEVKSLKEKAPGQPEPGRVFNINRADSLKDRPYSFLKAMGVYNRQLTQDEATVEMDISNKLNAHMKAHGYKKAATNAMIIPFWADALGEEAGELKEHVKALVTAGAGYDPEEVRYVAKKIGYRKDLSWVTDTSGGTLVPLAAQGELIELLRNKEAVVEAGASVFPLPPQGSISFPRQNSAMTAYWLSEKSTITKSDIGTGSVVLRAKKLAARGSIPNELFRYSNPAADAIVRNDVAQVLALALDSAALQGIGGDSTPTGIINTTSVGTYTATTVATDGNTFQPQDWSKMVGVVENSNAILNEATCSWVIRPKLYRALDARRADAVSAADAAGPFVEFMHQLAPPIVKQKCGYKVVTSNQVSGARTKGSGTTLTYVLFGDFSQLLMGMAGVMELDLNPWGDTPWSTDQTEIRGILQADIAARHPESFVYCDSLLQS